MAKPVGSGPYVVADDDPGRSVALKRDPNYWGRALPIESRAVEFDELPRLLSPQRQLTFRSLQDRTLLDVRSETDPSRWQTGYNFPAVRDGRIVKEAFANGLPKPTSAGCFSTRSGQSSPTFACGRRFRSCSMLDGTTISFGCWAQRELLCRLGALRLSAAGRRRERALLAAFPDAVRADVLDGTWSLPGADGSGRDRESLRQALALLSAAGYALNGTTLRERSSDAHLLSRSW